MKRLCLMALSLLMLSFNAFAQVKNTTGQTKVSVPEPVAPVLINVTTGEGYGQFPELIEMSNVVVFNDNVVALEGAYTYVIKGSLKLDLENSGLLEKMIEEGMEVSEEEMEEFMTEMVAMDFTLKANGANIIIDGGSITGTVDGADSISGANIFLINGGTIDENVTLSGCTMFARTDNGMATTIASGKWNFIGLYDNTNLTAFGSVSNASNRVWALQYNYANGNWGSEYCTYDNTFVIGEGVFVYPENQTTVPFAGISTPENVSITKHIKVNSGEIPNHSGGADNKVGAKTAYGYTGWFALSNPFIASINVANLISGISTQGGCVYTYNGGTWATRTSGSILPGQGFFIYKYVGSGNAVVDTPMETTVTLRRDWTTSSSKAASRDFLTVSVATDGYKVPVMFAQNDQATEEYDIFDANKLFGDGRVAEPYLVCNGIELCKEEVSSTNYTATMNIKSFESRSVEIVADNIPEGYSLTLLDGAVEVEMSEGDVYTTDITEGENADRFKLLINKNNVSIADVAEVESVRVVNNNRSIAIYGGKNVRTGVYNALGQKVYETSDRTFDLNNVAAGAYVLKVQDGKSVSSSKIIVR